ncbi:hypothetical protein K0U27_04730 [archaeon]|nr:hypothetical protein [archaeon]
MKKDTRGNNPVQEVCKKDIKKIMKNCKKDGFTQSQSSWSCQLRQAAKKYKDKGKTATSVSKAQT